ncbi:hypothetical protein CAPTEDRAFT_196769 [Capitella teleta]|uniref:TRPM SLOG domain-containing protein n=1 Tax=Capitella teleta TaxID=283909 RepID=R7TES6_CAPTE|nr:hypothetical protein CAPTEDRAFT_196769 [Capitella teleta]|eukprot:ELT91987.1 hypothetical protein CAPTEDRAFT_196769 [Capitella teleta]
MEMVGQEIAMELDFVAGGSRLQLPSRQRDRRTSMTSKEEEVEHTSDTEMESHFVRMLSCEQRKASVQDVDPKMQMVLMYWEQQTKKTVPNKKAMDEMDIRKHVDRTLGNYEVDNKEKVKEEVYFITNRFRQRRCTRFVPNEDNFYARAVRALTKKGMHVGAGKVYCKCGLEKLSHTDAARKANNSDRAWSKEKDTEKMHPWMFGNLDVPGHYNYLEMPGGTKKYLRLDDIKTDPRDVWDLLIRHWDLHPPNLVISVTGGDVSSLKDDVGLRKKFQDGIMKCCVKTKAWLITDGMAVGTARELGEIFQEDLRRSKYSELDEHANIPLIGIGPWGLLADRHQMQGIHVGSDEASYHYAATQSEKNLSESVPNALDPYHVVYLFTDDGTSGSYRHEPSLRSQLECFIKTQTRLKLLGSKAVNTPLVILVLGGDRFTLNKVTNAVKQDVQIPVVVVNGSGKIADMLATIYKALEYRVPRSEKQEYIWTEEEDQILKDHVTKFKEMGMLTSPHDVTDLKQLMSARHLIEVFGVEDSDTIDLDEAILTAIFGGISDVAVQLFLSLAMDRCDVAKQTIFIESRKEDLRKHSEMLQQALLVAMQTNKSDFVQLLLDQDYAGELNEFNRFLTVERLHVLHSKNLELSHIQGKLLRSLCLRDVYGSHVLDKPHLLPQVGRILHNLMGDLYRLLYQEKAFRDVNKQPIPCELTSCKKEEGAWHLFLWAVLSNQPKVAELFLYESNCKIAGKLAEGELQANFRENAEYFQELAIQTLDNLYAFNRDEAYSSLVALIPFHWAKYATPLSIADDAGAMRFMGHSCCQTFLNLVWMKYMDLDTPKWKLFPLMALFPLINISLIVFDKQSLSYGLYKQAFLTEEKEEKARCRHDSISEGSSTWQDPTDNKTTLDDNYAVIRTTRTHRFFRRIKFAWFCLQNYYTAPINKFLWNMVSYLVFLGIFTHFILSELRPVSKFEDVTIYEWLVNVWAFCITTEEITQFLTLPISGPMYNLTWVESELKHTWHWYERLAFMLKIYRFKRWISDRWNKMDALMLVSFYASVLLRFLLNSAHFALIRMLYSITLIIFYMRLLRIGYIMSNIGPRIVTIKAMLRDLFQFILILMVFIVSFGVAFQAILDSNQPPSWTLLVNVIWRPYWQMFGELFLEDATDGMGRESVERNCTYDVELAEANSDTMQICYNWTAPILLGIYMLITNILLLNLLIAIFSHSFELIESEALTIWRYHLYDLVHEYYYQVWLPPPLNILCHLINVLCWLSKWPRIWCYTFAKWKHRDDGKEDGQIELERVAEEQTKSDMCFPFYLDAKTREEEQLNHFIQPEYMRDEDLEEKAYKRYCRYKNKTTEEKSLKLMAENNSRLLVITNEIHELRQAQDFSSASSGLEAKKRAPEKRTSKTATRSSVQKKVSSEMARFGEFERMKVRLNTIDSKMDGISNRMESMSRDLELILDYVKEKK